MRKADATVNERRRRELLDAAFTLIAEKGLEGLRTRAIAARAGVNIATLHYYFGTKEALLLAVVRHVRDVFTRPAPNDRDATTAVPEDLRSYFVRAWRPFQANPGLARVLQELLLRAKRDRAARAALRSVHTHWTRSVEDILRRGIAAGQFRPDFDPGAGAAIVTSFTMGATARLGIDPKAFDFVETARELERLLTRTAT
jgi:AcrR family transcriptional regulator